LESDFKFQVVIEACNGNDLFAKLENANSLPDLVILDLSMPVMNGSKTTELLKKSYPNIKLIIFSIFSREDVILDLIEKGAHGFIQKGDSLLLIMSGIKTVLAGAFHISESINFRFSDKKRVHYASGFCGKEHLTENEIRFIRLAASDLTYKEMSHKLCISPKTLENYRDTIFKKLEIKNRSALIVYGYENGILEITVPSNGN
jgi:DNA-binding NarL/FixJ family response regulator